MAVIFKIDGQPLRCEAEIIAIGRSPSNQVSLPNDARLAPVHAILRLVSGRWIVESREGGPIRVGTGRPTQFAWLNSGDVIYLTESGPEVTFTLETASVKPSAAPEPVRPAVVSPQAPVAPSPLPVAGPADANPAGRPAAVPAWVALVGAGGLAAALLIGVGAYLGGNGHPAPRPEVTSKKPTPPEESPAPGEKSPGPATGPVAAPVVAIPAADPRRALFCLELRTADRRRTVQLGTAWAVAPRRLVTTGDAARGIALNQEFFPNAFARHTLTGEEFQIAGMALHPQYEAAAARLEQAIRDINRLKSELEAAVNPDERKKIEELLQSVDSQAIVAADESVNVNIAVVELSQDAVSSLTWASAPTLKIGQKVTLVGHPMSRTDQLVDPDHPVPVEQRVGRLQHADIFPDPVAPVRCLVRFDDALKNQNWSGSPVLNSEGSVIGLYARTTPPPLGSAAPPIATHDVMVIDGVRDWLPKSQSTPAVKN